MSRHVSEFMLAGLYQLATVVRSNVRYFIISDQISICQIIMSDHYVRSLCQIIMSDLYYISIVDRQIMSDHVRSCQSLSEDPMSDHVRSCQIMSDHVRCLSDHVRCQNKSDVRSKACQIMSDHGRSRSCQIFCQIMLDLVHVRSCQYLSDHIGTCQIRYAMPLSVQIGSKYLEKPGCVKQRETA